MQQRLKSRLVLPHVRHLVYQCLHLEIQRPDLPHAHPLPIKQKTTKMQSATVVRIDG